ncbi:MAG TPA: FkbM family methyltransferase [Thermoleophilaceae bacterium]
MTPGDHLSPRPLARPALPRPDGMTPYLLRRIARTDGEQRRAHLRELGFRMLRRVTPSVVVEDRGMRIHVQTGDLEMSRLVYIFGLFDEDLVRHALGVLGRGLEGRDFVDVGANIGTTTLAAVRCGAERVVAVEPAPANVATIRLNVADNGLGDRVRVVEAAASDRDGSVTLDLSPWNSGDHRVRTGREHEEAAGSVEVPARTLDSIVDDPDRVGLVWVDAQGHEAHVLAGAERVVEAGVPWVVEYWPYGLEAAGSLDRLHDLVAERFGRFVDLRAGGGERPAGEVASLAGRYGGVQGFTDLLLLP